MKIKKIATVLGSALMIGSSVAMAAAAAYPAPFVQSGAANVAIVVGSNGAEPSDMIAATDISADLAKDLSAQAVGGVTVVTGGETFQLEKSSDNLNLGDNLRSVLTEGKLDDKDMPVLLADGIYEDDNGEEYDYNQKLYLTDKSFTLIVDKDYKDKDPTLGLNYQDGQSVLSYNITYESDVNMTAMPTTDLTIAGKDYYVLTADYNTIELLDTASSTTISEGEKVTVKVGGNDYEVEVSVYDDGAVFTVNGEESDQLTTGDYDKLSDGSYLVAKSVRYSTKESGVSKVEFSIGAGKITLENGNEVKVNSDTIDGLYANISGTDATDDTLQGISFDWLADGDTFLTGAEGYSQATMPLFGAVSLVNGGFDFPATTENTELVSSDDYITLETEILEGSLSLPILYRDDDTSNFTGLGEDSDTVLVTNVTVANSTQNYNLTLDEDTDSYFVVTYIKGEDGYTYAYELSSITEADGETTLSLSGLTGEADVELIGISDYADLDDITLTLVGNGSVGDNNATIEVSTSVSGATVYSDRIVTAAGLMVKLPNATLVNAANTTEYTAAEAMAIAIAGVSNDAIDLVKYNDSTTHEYTTVGLDSSWIMNFSEEDKDGDIADGIAFTATISAADTDGVHVSATNVSEQETLDKDMYIGYVFSDLATKIEMDKSGDTNTFVVLYNGEEVAGDVSVTTGMVSSDSAELGTITVLDSEASKMSGKNLIVVGGNCVNSVAADLLGLSAGASCMADFSAKTGVANGGFLIESFNKDGKVAMLVAGYSAQDTTKAKTYLVNNNVETMAGTKLVGTSATEATVVTA